MAGAGAVVAAGRSAAALAGILGAGAFFATGSAFLGDLAGDLAAAAATAAAAAAAAADLPRVVLGSGGGDGEAAGDGGAGGTGALAAARPLGVVLVALGRKKNRMKETCSVKKSREHTQVVVPVPTAQEERPMAVHPPAKCDSWLACHVCEEKIKNGTKHHHVFKTRLFATHPRLAVVSSAGIAESSNGVRETAVVDAADVFPVAETEAAADGAASVSEDWSQVPNGVLVRGACAGRPVVCEDLGALSSQSPNGVLERTNSPRAPL